jgi:hypothetical protein
MRAVVAGLGRTATDVGGHDVAGSAGRGGRCGIGADVRGTRRTRTELVKSHLRPLADSASGGAQGWTPFNVDSQYLPSISASVARRGSGSLAARLALPLAGLPQDLHFLQQSRPEPIPFDLKVVARLQVEPKTLRSAEEPRQA